jgi:hypothetical protein
MDVLATDSNQLFRRARIRYRYGQLFADCAGGQVMDGYLRGPHSVDSQGHAKRLPPPGRRLSRGGASLDRTLIVKAEPNDNEPALPLAPECPLPWPTVRAGFDSGEYGNCGISREHSPHELRQGDRLAVRIPLRAGSRWLSDHARDCRMPRTSQARSRPGP